MGAAAGGLGEDGGELAGAGVGEQPGGLGWCECLVRGVVEGVESGLVPGVLVASNQGAELAGLSVDRLEGVGGGVLCAGPVRGRP